MNFPRLALSAVVAWVVSMAIGFVVNEYPAARCVHAERCGLSAASLRLMAGLPLGFGVALDWVLRLRLRLRKRI